jgi:hypothetical protein
MLLRALAWLLLAGWAVTVGLALWTRPAETTQQQLRADIAAGRVDHYEVVYGTWTRQGPWNVSTTDFNPSPNGPGIAWSLHDGRRRWASITGVPVGLDSSPPQAHAPLNPDGTPTGQADPVVAPLVAALDRAGATSPVPQPEVLDPVVAVVAVVGLIMLVTGPPPQRGTKWFWFWLLGVSAGLGLVAWLVLEQLFPPQSPVRRRERGITGFAVSFVAASLVNVSLTFLA